MTSLESYLDQSCARLSVNPAEAEDIREELRSHLQELIAEHLAAGLDRRAATARALAQVGEARSLRESLDRVHTGDPWWVWRLKGLVLGAVLGGIISLLLPLGGHLEIVARLFGPLAAWDPTRIHLVANGLIAGGLIGLLSRARGFFIGWFAGSLIWMAEYVAYFIITVATNTTPPDGALHLFNSVLLSPVLGGLFGALVGGLCTTLLTAAARLRPEIR